MVSLALVLTLSPQAAAFVLVVDLIALPFFKFSARVRPVSSHGAR